MKQTIFFTDKFITFSDEPLKGYDLVIDSRSDTIAEISRAKVVDFFEKYNSILFLCHTPQDAYSLFCREFRRVKAAGGIVRNASGQALMIYRNGRWDLPKGHVEYGETFEQCAVREVAEETGLRSLKLGEKITETLHAYIYSAGWEVKTTHWYAMLTEQTETVAQSEEGIEKVAWCSKAEVAENLNASYPTIREVFKAEK